MRNNPIGIIYTRTTYNNQLLAHNDIANQISICLRKAFYRDIEIVAVFTDLYVDGNSFQRIGLYLLNIYSQKEQNVTILVDKLETLFYRSSDLESYLEILPENTNIISCKC